MFEKCANCGLVVDSREVEKGHCLRCYTLKTGNIYIHYPGGWPGHVLADKTEKLLRWAESQLCAHEDTYRGGAIWTICSQCGMKWPDDGDSGPEDDKEPKEISEARKALEEYKNEQS